jgi:hypothetical protein
MKLYHGSNCLFEKIDLSKSKDKRDFGKGFYTTEMALELLKYNELNDQVSFHTEKSLSFLILARQEKNAN